MFSSGSHASIRPPANPYVLNPIDSNAQLPAKIMRSDRLVGEPRVFSTPVEVFVWFPRVDPAAGEPIRLESHRLQRAVAGQDHEVRSAGGRATCLLDPSRGFRLVPTRRSGRRRTHTS